jgi:membrane protease YdiL (CAAX protease family)
MDIRSTALVQEATAARRGTPLVVAWLVAFVLAVIVVANMLVDPFVWQLFGYPADGTPLSELILLFTNAATLIVLGLWVVLWEQRPFASIGLRAGNWWRLLGVGLAAGMALLAAPALLLLLAGQLANDAAPGVATHGTAALPVVLAFIPVWFVQSGAEEAVMRGYLLQRHALRLPAWPAILVVSIGFALAHQDFDPIVLANTILFSIFVCFVALATGSLWLGIGIHAGWNMAQGNIFGIPVSGTALSNSILALGPAPDARPWLTGGDYGIEGSLFVTVVLLVASVLSCRHFMLTGDGTAKAGARRLDGGAM